MTDRDALPPNVDFITVQGPQGLRAALDDLLTKSKADPAFAAADHCLIYELGEQRSLIKVDTKHIPFVFYYNDLLGRPATRLVKETIANFLHERCGIAMEELKEFGG